MANNSTNAAQQNVAATAVTSSDDDCSTNSLCGPSEEALPPISVPWIWNARSGGRINWASASPAGTGRLLRCESRGVMVTLLLLRRICERREVIGQVQMHVEV
jgi:hypothetical protein